MKQILMRVLDKKFKIKPGITTVGNTQFCNIQIPVPECFKLNYEANCLWIQPSVNLLRINGFGENQTLLAGREYELDLTTGEKKIIAFNETITFEFLKPPIIKINLIKQNKQTNKSIEPPIVKKVQTESKSSTNTPKKTQRRHYLNVQNYIKELNGFYKLKFSNFYIHEDDQIKLLKLGIYIDPENYNILIMDTFKRTYNLLLALNEGKIVVSSQWIKDCLGTMKVQNPYLYVLKTTNLSLLQSIEQSLTCQVFSGKKYFLSQGLKSNLKEQEIIHLIEAGGGNYGLGENSIPIVNNGEKGGIEIEQLLQMILYQKA